MTPSQSASQTAQGVRYGPSGAAYQRPAFAEGAPHESAEERADSDASSEADAQEYEDARAQFNNLQSPGLEPPPIPSKGQNYFAPPATSAPQHQQQQQGYEHQSPIDQVAATAAPPLRPAREARPLDNDGSYHNQYPAQSQPQMHVATAPRFNYDGTQLSAVPQAPRLYNRDQEDSSDDDEPRNTTAHQGWSARPTRGAGDSSDEEGARGKPTRPKAEKRSSFLGKVGRLFKTDLKDSDGGGSGHRRQNSANERGSFQSDHRQHDHSAWQSRTDRHLKDAHRDNVRALGGHQSTRQSLLQPLSHSHGNESSSDDEDNRDDLVRHVNPSWSGRKATSDVGATLKRTPSQQHSITAGPLSARQKREMEEREHAENERKAREAVIGGGFASGGLPQRSNTVKTAGTTGTKKKKKKTQRPGSIAGSEVGTAPTRSSPLVTATAPGPQRPSSYIVHGDLSSGSRGLASLVLPSDIAKDEQRTKAGYPSQLQPPSGSGLTRSNSTATAATGKSSTIKKKKKRQSAISEGPGTGLTSMSPKDGGKYTTNTWVQPSSPAHGAQGGAGRDGLASNAVANAGLVPHTPATQEQIAKKQASAGLSIPRPSSAQSTPLKSALKHHSSPSQHSPRAPEASLGPAIHAPPSASAVLAEAGRPGPAPVAAQAPVLPTPQPNINTPIEEKPRPEPVLNLGTDQNIDGSGRFLSRENSSAEGLDLPAHSQARTAGENGTPRRPYPAPKIDMPSSEPFNIDYTREEQQRQGGRGVAASTPNDALYSAALTPNESATYQKWLETAPSGPEPDAAAPASANQQRSGPAGVTRVTANRHKIGSSVDLDKEPQPPSSQPPAPSRTYSSEGKTLHSARSGDVPNGAASGAIPGSLAATLMLPSSTSGGLSDVSAGTAESGVARRKSVRIAPDTKLPPETPPGDHQQQMSDGFGGFVSPYTTSSLHSVSAPGSSLSRSNSGAKDHHRSSQQQPQQASSQPASTLSSRIAPPPQAPPRLPAKEANPRLSGERERSGWSTRIDRRLASAADSSDEEDGAANNGGGGMSGDEIDAYASARRAMGMAHRHWTEATSPAKKKSSSKKAADGADTGSVRSKGSKKAKKSSSSNSGYNKDIPLPKGMEVVGRQKASKS